MRVLPLWNLDYSQWNLDTANEMRVLLHLLLLYNLQYHSLLPIDIPRAHGSNYGFSTHYNEVQLWVMI